MCLVSPARVVAGALLLLAPAWAYAPVRAGADADTSAPARAAATSSAAGTAERLVEQRAIAYRMKRAAIWAGARNAMRAAREHQALERRARHGDAAAGRGLRARRADEGGGPLNEPIPAPFASTPAPFARLADGPFNSRCNDPSGDAADAGQAEASVAASGDHVVVAWNDGQGFNVAMGDVQGYGWSADGGHTFTDGGVPPHPGAYPGFRWTSDPVMTVNERTGEFYYCGLADTDPTHNAVAIARGRFAGGAFAFDSAFVVRSVPSAVLFLDKPWIACDSSSGHLYVSVTTFGLSDTIDFHRSTDGGRTWSAPLALSSASDAGNVQGSRVAVGPDGEIAAAWYAADPAGDRDHVRFRRSVDRGVSFGAESTPVSFYAQFGTGAPGFNRTLGVNFPALAIDRTGGTHRGRTYLAWPECWHFLGIALPPAGATNRSEVETGNSAAAATPFTPGQTLRGVLVPAGGVQDQDWFAFPLAAGQNVVVLVDSAGPAYWYTRLMAPDGSQRLCLGGNPSGTSANSAYFTFTAPVSGTYYLRMLETSTTASIGYRIRTATGARGGERGRDQRDAFVAWSDDGGASWSDAARVNDEPVGYDDWLPEVCVGADGGVYAMWTDHRDATWGSRAHTYLSRSTDGGASWAQARRLSDTQGNFTTCGTNIAPNMGDYSHIASSGAALHAVWADARGTDVDVWSAAVPSGATLGPAPRDTTVGVPVTVTVGWTIASSNPLFAGLHTVSIRSERAWPMPANATAVLGTGSGVPPDGAPASVPWTADITVPDTAAAGPNRICITLASPAGVVMDRACFTITARPDPLGVAGVASRVLALAPGWPNPARDDVRIAFTLPHAGHARLVVYDLTGARVRTLIEGACPAGGTSVTWDGRDLRGRSVRSGAYFYRLEFEGQTRSRRLVFMR